MRRLARDLALFAALILGIIALLLAFDTRDPRAPEGSFLSRPAQSSGSSSKWPRCDFDGNPTNDRPGECPPYPSR